jgi:hypothetical protein
MMMYMDSVMMHCRNAVRNVGCLQEEQFRDLMINNATSHSIN